MNLWNVYDKKQLKELELFAKDYRDFLDAGKTERECVDIIINLIEQQGYVELVKLQKENKKIMPGDRVYAVKMDKSIILYQIGAAPMEKGMNILGAHIDSPRLDIKMNPLYEEGGFAYMDTHYYGGIKKYQWVTIPLSLHGVVVKKDGTTVILNIGEDEDDPVFFISDLLVHLASEQLEKKAAKVIEAEALDIIVGSKPIVINEGNSKDAVKKGILAILKDTYDIEEEDFVSAELEVVPAGLAREVGFDRSMIMAYGQDDRVCAFAALRAILEMQNNKDDRTCCCILTDKEEIGSVGATGMRSHFFYDTTAEVMNLKEAYHDLLLRRCMENSNMLSCDVTSAFDPTYSAEFDKNNVAYFGKGIVIKKFSGIKGKSGTNDANAEYIGKIRGVFEHAGILSQSSEMGKVDVGGGGTIAYMLALYGMNVVDMAVPLLNMHAPYEVTSKSDLYETMRGYKAFLEEMAE